MKIKIKQLTEHQCQLISAALFMAADYWEKENPHWSDEASLLSVQYLHTINLMVSNDYPDSVDDVQVLGKQEKGGE